MAERTTHAPLWHILPMSLSRERLKHTMEDEWGAARAEIGNGRVFFGECARPAGGVAIEDPCTITVVTIHSKTAQA